MWAIEWDDFTAESTTKSPLKKGASGSAFLHIPEQLKPKQWLGDPVVTKLRERSDSQGASRNDCILGIREPA